MQVWEMVGNGQMALMMNMEKTAISIMTRAIQWKGIKLLRMTNCPMINLNRFKNFDNAAEMRFPVALSR